MRCLRILLWLLLDVGCLASFQAAVPQEALLEPDVLPEASGISDATGIVTGLSDDGGSVWGGGDGRWQSPTSDILSGPFAMRGDSFSVREGRIVQVQGTPSDEVSATTATGFVDDIEDEEQLEEEQEEYSEDVVQKGDTAFDQEECKQLSPFPVQSGSALNPAEAASKHARSLPPLEDFLNDHLYLTGSIFAGVDAELRRLLGPSSLSVGDTNGSVESKTTIRTRRVHPRFYEPRDSERALCGLFDEIGGPGEARVHIHQDLLTVPEGEVWRFWNALSITWRCEGHARRALTCLLHALRIQRRNGQKDDGLRFNIAMVFQHSGLMREAHAVLSRVLKGTSAPSQVHVLALCDLNVLLEQHDEVKRCIERFDIHLPNVTDNWRKKIGMTPALRLIDAEIVAPENPTLAQFYTNEFYAASPTFDDVGRIGGRIRLSSIAQGQALVYKSVNAEQTVCPIFQQEGGVDRARRRIVGQLIAFGFEHTQNFELWNGLGNSWRCSGHAFRAIRCFLKAESLIGRPDGWVAINIASVLRHAGQLADARVVLETSQLQPAQRMLSEYLWCEITVSLVEIGQENRFRAQQCVSDLEVRDNLSNEVGALRKRLGRSPPIGHRTQVGVVFVLLFGFFILFALGVYSLRARQAQRHMSCSPKGLNKLSNGSSSANNGRARLKPAARLSQSKH